MYYDYEVQGWVEDGIVQPCEHKTPMAGCAGCKYPGMNIEDVRTLLLQDRESTEEITIEIVGKGDTEQLSHLAYNCLEFIARVILAVILAVILTEILNSLPPETRGKLLQRIEEERNV